MPNWYAFTTAAVIVPVGQHETYDEADAVWLLDEDGLKALRDSIDTAAPHIYGKE